MLVEDDRAYFSSFLSPLDFYLGLGEAVKPLTLLSSLTFRFFIKVFCSFCFRAREGLNGGEKDYYDYYDDYDC